MTAIREPFVARIAELLRLEIDRTDCVPEVEHFMYRIVMPEMPDATIAEVRAGVQRYMSTIPANDFDEDDSSD